MRTQKTTLGLIILLITLMQVVLTSCSSNKVVSSSFIQKRKYTSGYHFSFTPRHSKKQEREVEVEKNVKEDVEINLLPENVLVEDNTTSSRIDVGSCQVAPEYFSGRKEETGVPETGNQILAEFNCNSETFQDHRLAKKIKEVEKKEQDERDKKNSNIRMMLLIASLVCIFLIPGVGFIFGAMFGIASLCVRGKKREKNGKSDINGWAILGVILLAIVVTIIVLVLLWLLLSAALSGFSFALGC